MKNNSNAIVQFKCESSDFVIFKASEINRFSRNNENEYKRPSKSTVIQLNPKRVPNQPLKGLNSAINDYVGLAVFCSLLVFTGTLVWMSFS